ncbi:uncharacterized protein LOC113507271 [Trichoplusia ni]|uniref:Uncharacterized protein LOC113507271 n=1 Tax=Trichoplusia ni TaxID=7111 RepID=A0A7E5X0F0_TRINI|nr:uncharacterized protein LOC113507271 [Trichoplusia ni]
MGEPTEHWDTLIIYLIVTKLDSVTCKEWEDKKNTCSKESKVTLDDLLQFLKDRSDVLDMVQAQGHKQNIESTKRLTISPSQPPQQVRTFVTNKQLLYRAGSSRDLKCVMCDGNHALFSCIKFLNLPVQDRHTFVSNNKGAICPNCLRAGHTIQDYQFGSCKQCSQKHNSLIHTDSSASCNSLRFMPTVAHTKAHDALTRTATDGAHANTSLLNTHSNISYHTKQAVQSNTLEQVLLSTALVEVCNNNNTYIAARALLDSGSQRCFITDALCKKLRLSTIQSTLTITGIGNSVMRSEQSCDLVMRSRTSNFSTLLNCSVLPKITFRLPNSHIDFNSLQIPQHVKLADPEYNIPSDIDILIGADVFGIYYKKVYCGYLVGLTYKIHI